MSLVDFSELIVKKLVKEPDLVKVQEFDSEDNKTIEILVAEADMGRIIGKEGRIIRAIREIINSYGMKNSKKVLVNVEENK